MEQASNKLFGVDVLNSLSEEEWNTLYVRFLLETHHGDQNMSRIAEFKTMMVEMMSEVKESAMSMAKGIDILVTVGRLSPQFLDELKTLVTSEGNGSLASSAVA